MAPKSTPVLCMSESGGFILAGTKGGGLFRSGDGGETWTTAATGIPNADVNDLALIDGRVLTGYAGGILYSDDHGGTWTADSISLARKAVTSLATLGSHVFAAVDSGVFRSSDSGKSCIAGAGKLSSKAELGD